MRPGLRVAGLTARLGVAAVALVAALIYSTGTASASGTLAVSWSPSSPTSSTPVTVTGTISGCGAGNTTIPSLYDDVTGPNGYSNNQYLGSSTTLSNDGDSASASVSLGTLPAGSYTVYFYGRGTPCFSSSYNFTWTSAETMVVGAGATAPAVPAAPAATVNSDGSVGLSWSAPADNGATITGYTVTPSPACSSCTGLSVSGNPAATSTTITGLASGTPYTFTITATNSAGTSTASPQSNTVTPATAPTPTSIAVAPSTTSSSVGDAITLTASVTPAPTGGSVTFTDDGSAIPGCTDVPVGAGTGDATCETAALPAGLQTIGASFSGSIPLAPATAPAAATVEVSEPITASATGPSLPAGGVASLSAMRRITDPYVINEHDVAGLVVCAGTGSCQVALGASVRLGTHGRLVRLPSTSAAIAADQSAIVRLRDRAHTRARIRSYLRRHRHQHLMLVLTLTSQDPGGYTVTRTYSIALRTLAGLR